MNKRNLEKKIKIIKGLVIAKIFEYFIFILCLIILLLIMVSDTVFNFFILDHGYGSITTFSLSIITFRHGIQYLEDALREKTR